MLRMKGDEQLIALTRRGNHAAFEVLCARYQARLLAFCRHMLRSKEDAEDVLQEVYAAAFNAVLADDREINVKPWLYRIARNRSLNHLRRASAVGVDTMDTHFAEHGITTTDKVMRRESFHELVGDVQELPESQRTALLLREIEDLSYDQIAVTMETTVPSVKSLLVRARMSLADAAEARRLTCEDVRLELGEQAEGLAKLSTAARRHTRECKRCATFKKTLKDNNKALAALMPFGPALLFKKLLFGSKFGSTTSAGHAAGGVGAGTATGAAAGGSVSGGLLTAGAGAVASKAVAGIAAAALVTAGAVAVTPSAPAPARHTPTTTSAATEARGLTGGVALPVSRIAAHHSRASHAARGVNGHAASLAAGKTAAKPPATPAATTPAQTVQSSSEHNALPVSSTEATGTGSDVATTGAVTPTVVGAAETAPTPIPIKVTSPTTQPAGEEGTATTPEPPVGGGTPSGGTTPPGGSAEGATGSAPTGTGN
jgi:RNA polymerase sigma factor (sigma-70 family)